MVDGDERLYDTRLDYKDKFFMDLMSRSNQVLKKYHKNIQN